MVDLLPLDKILPNPMQPRSNFSVSELQELASTIREHGVLNPIVVERNQDLFILIDGERRLRAARLAGLTEIPANIREGSQGDTEKLTMALVCNIQRSDMNPIEEGRAYQKLSDMGLSNTTIAHQVGVSSTRVVARKELLLLENDIQTLIAEGMLPIDPRATRAFLSIPNKEVRLKTAQKLARPGVTIKVIQDTCGNINESLRAMNIQKEDLPSLKMAAIRTSSSVSEPANWNALQQIGKVPPWSMVTRSARDMCDRCALRDSASYKNCRDCAGVELLKNLLRYAGNENGH